MASGGYKHTEEHNENIREAMLGIKHTKERCLNISKSLTGRKLSEEHRKNITLGKKKYYENHKAPRFEKKSSPEHIKKALKRNPKSSLEIKFENLVNQIGLPYKFVGNGEVMVARKVPDFIHKNKKIAVEVYYRRHKEQFRGGLEVWKAERMKIFNENGWKIVFFNETEVKEDLIKQKLGEIIC